MATLFELAAHIQSVDGAETLLMMIAKATVILLIARLLLMTMPRASAATKHAVATAALVGVAAMPVLTFFTPAWYVPIERLRTERVGAADVKPAGAATAAAAKTGNKQIGVTGEDEPAAAQRETPTKLGTAIDIARASGVVPDEPLSAASRALNVAKNTWKGWFVIIVQFIAMLMLAQMILGMLGVWFVARSAEEVTHDEALRELDAAHDQLALGREVRLLRSSRISVPVLWGFFRPVLLLPADVPTWPVERLRVVLLHELAHLKRYDGISLILTRIAVSLFWYHPLAWSLERAGRNECERSCDDLVLSSGTKPSVYADHLLAIARSMPSFDPFRSVTLAMSRKSQLEGRLLSILQPHVVRRALTGRGVVFACALALLVIAPLSAIRLGAAPPDEVPVATANVRTDVKADAVLTVTPDIQAIENYFVAKLGKYDKRIDRFAREPRNGKDWFERAYDYYRNDRFADAAIAFKNAAEEGYREDVSLYNAACSHALLGETEPAITALQAAITAGWDDIDKIAEDSDFDPIRQDPRFARAIAASTGRVVNERVEKTMRRYENLKAGRVNEALNESINDGVRDGVSVAESVASSVAQAVTEALTDHDYDYDFDFDSSKLEKTQWFAVGLDLLRLRKLDESIHAFQKSIEKGEKVSTSMYNIACAYSLKGDAEQGMRWLERAIEEGFSGDTKLQNDPDIALLRQRPEFLALRRKAKELETRMWGHDGDHDDDEDDDDGWENSVEHHKRMTQKYPNSGRAWFALGYVALQARDFDTAFDAYNRAIALGHRVGASSYNKACGYALAGNKDAAFDWLKKARDAGFDLLSYLRNDDDLDNLRSDPRFRALLEDVRAESRKSAKQ
jgi:beta-lactamase regulating signal transducer with metallopeptidase domain/tetratricopeptide (TPR) repeat protein